MDIILTDEWKKLLTNEITASYFKEMMSKLDKQEFFPPKDKIFNAFNLLPLNKIKVVILGQDPYHDDNQAMGLAFSVPAGVTLPPSLRNIYKEINNEFNTNDTMSPSGDLTPLVKQGVFLLNTSLTVAPHVAGSHTKIGWQKFTDAVIKLISDKQNNVVFLLWGNHAAQKEELINAHKHLILKSVHPSPLSASRGWWGNNHFITTNSYLEKHDKSPIKWNYWE